MTCEVVLYHHGHRLCLRACRGIVKTELLVLQQIAVVWLEHRSVLHSQRAFSVMLKIADSIDGAVKLTLRLQLAADFNGLSTHNVLWYRHRLHLERIRLLNVQLIAAR